MKKIIRWRDREAEFSDELSAVVDKSIAKLAIVLPVLVALALGACSTPSERVTPVEVQVPVPVRAVPPAELLAAGQFPATVFVPLNDPRAAVAVTVEGKDAIIKAAATIRVWRAWATARE